VSSGELTVHFEWRAVVVVERSAAGERECHAEAERLPRAPRTHTFLRALTHHSYRVVTSVAWAWCAYRTVRYGTVPHGTVGGAVMMHRTLRTHHGTRHPQELHHRLP
jgi:hypothetical protein